MVKINKKIELGKCPYCDSYNYSRDIRDLINDYLKVDCHCNECNDDFIEYFGLDEVYFNQNKEQIYATNTLGDDEKTILIKALNLLINKENDVNDYSNIMNKLNNGVGYY